MKKEINKKIYDLYPILKVKLPRKKAKYKTKLMYEWEVTDFDNSYVNQYDVNDLCLDLDDFDLTKNREIILRKFKIIVNFDDYSHDKDDMIALVNLKTKTFETEFFSDGSKIPKKFYKILDQKIEHAKKV